MSPSGVAAPHVAIVGSGPSGCYGAQMLRKQWPDAEITVFDRLPVPFGLLRYGVAPDHQHTKNLAHQFSRTFQDERTRFAGNVEIGRDVTVEQLRESFHVVLLAAGLSADRLLDIPGEDLEGVMGAGRFMRWVNSHPDEAGFQLQTGERTVVVGAGNVAVDVLRILVKADADLIGSDLDDSVAETIVGRQPHQVHVVSRSPAEAAKFDAAMVRELRDLEGVSFRVDGMDLDPAEDYGDAKVRELAHLVARESPAHVRVEVTFHFGWTPVAINGDSHVTGVTFASTTNEGSDERVIAADSVISAIGFVATDGDPLLTPWSGRPGDGTDRARLDVGVYSCGWFRRGASGSIPTNRSCAKEVVGLIAGDLGSMPLDPRPGFAQLAPILGDRVVTFEGWQRIDAVETAAADDRRVRRKLSDWPSLVDVGREQHAAPDTVNTAHG